MKLIKSIKVFENLVVHLWIIFDFVISTKSHILVHAFISEISLGSAPWN